ncbi:MAG: VTT domain-containing protein [Candidatus Acidiferrales bacterium]
MQPTAIKFPLWLQHLVASLGGVGLFVVALLDSSVLSFPVVTDLLVLEESIRKPALMPYYAAMASIGSLAGCIWLYLLAKKGGEAFFHHGAKAWARKIRDWVESHAFFSVFIPALLPPPMPFKAFVIAEGVFQVPLRTFVIGLLLGRGLRYFGEGFLAVRYGDAAIRLLLEHKTALLLAFLVICVAIVVVDRLLKRGSSC